MDARLRLSRDIIIAIAVSFLATASQWIYSVLADWLFPDSADQNTTTIYGLLFLLILVLVVLVDVFVRLVLVNSKSFREAIFRDKNIEGYWYNIAVDMAKGEIREVAVITISFENGSMKLDGILHSQEGHRIGHFHGDFVRYSGRQLDYIYSRGVRHKNREDGRGYGRYDFAREKPHPLSFEGHFHDQSLQTEIAIFGKRVSSKDEVKELEADSETSMSEFAKRKADEFRELRNDLFREAALA